MKQMPNPVTSEILADVQAVLCCKSLDYLPNLIEKNSGLADRYSFVQRLLSYGHDFLLNFMFGSPIKDSEVVISMISVNEGCDININFIS
jgi:hypothetical protein